MKKRVMQQEIDNWKKAANVRKKGYSGNLPAHTQMKLTIVVKEKKSENKVFKKIMDFRSLG